MASPSYGRSRVAWIFGRRQVGESRSSLRAFAGIDLAPLLPRSVVTGGLLLLGSEGGRFNARTPLAPGGRRRCRQHPRIREGGTMLRRIGQSLLAFLVLGVATAASVAAAPQTQAPMSDEAQAGGVQALGLHPTVNHA